MITHQGSVFQEWIKYVKGHLATRLDDLLDVKSKFLKLWKNTVSWTPFDVK